ncbi:flagellar basal body-associated FliL family protein [Sphingomonas sp. PAMC 26605]|uniref:flagellar basal body-associated FliL family protein n=1 Tax=Sphingomonas sp. PAMC 26605 TaxID=1112214 RepID=UPI00026CD6B3|nr:flagellar basal body-associated FliL family protein [Sphingomonas sp. PAMC 26605]
MSAVTVDAVEGGPPPAKRKNKLIIIGAAAALVLAGGGGGAFFFLGGTKDAKTEKAAKPNPAAEAGEGAEAESFLDVPPVVVNLHSTDGATRYLKLHFELVAAPGVKAEELKKRLPLVIDAIQPFLRELRPEDLAGSAAVFRIKEQILLRAGDALGPDQVKDVLIEDLIQQ